MCFSPPESTVAVAVMNDTGTGTPSASSWYGVPRTLHRRAAAHLTTRLNVANAPGMPGRSEGLGDFLDLITPFVEVAYVSVAAGQFYDGEAH